MDAKRDRLGESPGGHSDLIIRVPIMQWLMHYHPEEIGSSLDAGSRAGIDCFVLRTLLAPLTGWLRSDLGEGR
jgi:hypothetical protein